MNQTGTIYERNKAPPLVLNDDPPQLQEKIMAPLRKLLPKAHEKETQVNNTKLDEIVEKAGNVLFRAHSVFPFDLFPDSVTIDETKVSIIHRVFFLSGEVQSIPIQHIKDVITDTSILFATLKILPEGFNENWVEVKYLWKYDALKARRILSGLLVGYREGIHLEKVETPQFTEKIEVLGAVN